MSTQPTQLEFDAQGTPTNLAIPGYHPVLLYGYELVKRDDGAMDALPAGPVVACWDRRFCCWMKTSGSQVDWIPTHYAPVANHPGAPAEGLRQAFEQAERARYQHELEKTGRLAA